AGDGLSMMSYSPHKAQAAEFLTFMTTKQAASIVNAAGLIPAINGTSTSNPVNQQMLDFVSQGGMTAYPMLDNVVQGNVVNIGSKFLPAVLNGGESIPKARQPIKPPGKHFPPNRRGTPSPNRKDPGGGDAPAPRRRIPPA